VTVVHHGRADVDAHQADPAHPWDRRGDETDKAWSAFRRYLFQREGERSLRRVAKAIGHTDHRYVSRWSSCHAWVERARAYDEWLWRQIESERREETIRLAIRRYEAYLARWSRSLDRLADIDAPGLRAAIARGDAPPDGADLVFARLAALDRLERDAGLEDPSLVASIARVLAEPGRGEDATIELLRDLLEDVSPAAALELLGALRRRHAE
jgi:hypothetical protein